MRCLTNQEKTTVTPAAAAATLLASVLSCVIASHFKAGGGFFFRSVSYAKKRNTGEERKEGAWGITKYRTYYMCCIFLILFFSYSLLFRSLFSLSFRWAFPRSIGRLTKHPFRRRAKAKEESDRRHIRVPGLLAEYWPPSGQMHVVIRLQLCLNWTSDWNKWKKMEGTSDLIFKGRWKKRELSLVFGKHYQSRETMHWYIAILSSGPTMDLLANTGEGRDCELFAMRQINRSSFYCRRQNCSEERDRRKKLGAVRK